MTSTGSRPVLVVEAAFRRLARLRKAPAFHPTGLTCTAELEIVDDGRRPWGVPWMDSPARYSAKVRLSLAVLYPLGWSAGFEQGPGSGESAGAGA